MTNPYILWGLLPLVKSCSLFLKQNLFWSMLCHSHLHVTSTSAFSTNQYPLLPHRVLWGHPERITSAPIPYNVPLWHPQLTKSTVTAYSKSKTFHHSLAQEKIGMIQLESQIYFRIISLRPGGKDFLVMYTCPFLDCGQRENSHRRFEQRANDIVNKPYIEW